MNCVEYYAACIIVQPVMYIMNIREFLVYWWIFQIGQSCDKKSSVFFSCDTVYKRVHNWYCNWCWNSLVHNNITILQFTE